MALGMSAASFEPTSPTSIRYTAPDGQRRTATYFRVLTVRTPRLSGADVREVQRRLRQVLPDARGLTIDGYYGPVTAAAVRRYQLRNDLTPDGRVNFDTWEVLFDVGE
ncbi:hypothetical protein GCM10008939_22940 [Deinococcus aquiradiocola]|uniref:Peptidoglycan binding-like domain-containing protein n=1 Tax=Deinococcus aquiradiocola TaxID=393059 RepID=A0A917PH43_9DEIO|nr:hypothetical protein GCM10008939_22940 [Deinococcus aquiradiocola]